MTFLPMRPRRLDLEAFARATCTHPELIRRFVVLGLVEAERDAQGVLWFPADQIAEIGRIRRLREGFALNYASLGLVCDLLDRIAVLESAVRRRPRQPGGRSWT